ncbi:MAG: hypothetical protein ABI759_00145 [Candidatus Solibacter sp.]
MKLNVCVTILLVAASNLGLQAQTMKLTANIPFPFYAGKVAMPAGEYTVNHDRGILTVRKADGRSSGAMFLTRQENLPKPAANPVLVFNQYGNTFFLSSVRSPYASDGVTIPKTRTEIEYAKAATQPTITASVPLQTH